MCHCGGETVNHSLLHYDVTYASWCEVFNMFWSSMDDAYYSNIFFIWVEELVWETIFSDLEYGATMFDVVSVEGTPLSYVQGY